MLKWVRRKLDGLRQRAAVRRMPADRAVGMRGEDIAHRFLEERGYAVIARNYRPPHGRGEVDLVASKDGALVFVEVKSRLSGEFGDPVRAIDGSKRRALIQAAAAFARSKRAPYSAVRFDVVSVILDQPVRVRHIENVFPFPLR